ncbi:MAG: hypothetical protein OEY89_18355, partial [Gammaproteobacteria bacterium]|nr:hypothetical protein [Gammaproteobacteria bacterium]
MSHQNHRISTKFLLSTSLIFIFLVTPNNQINAFDFKHTNKNITEWQDLLLNQLLSQGVDEDNLKKADKLINAVRQHLSKGNKTIVKSQLSQIGPALGKLLLAYDLFEKLVKEDYANVAWDSMSLIVTETMTLNSITLFSGAVSATGVGAILTGVKTTYDSYKALEASKRGVALERFLRMVQFDPQLRDKGKMPSVNSKMVERFLQVYVIQNRNDGRALTKEFVETVLQGTWPDVFRSASWWERFAYDMDKGQAMYEGDAEINQLKSYIAAMLKDIFRMYEIRQRAKETYEKMREQKEMLEAYQKIVMYLENQIDSTNPDWAVKKYDELIKKGPGLLAKKRQGNGDYLSGLRGELSDFSSDLAYLQRHLSQSGLFYTNATAMLDKLNSLMKSTQEALNEVRTRYQSVMDKELTAIYKDVEAPWPDFEFDIPDVVVNCLQNVRERNRNAQRPWELKLGYAYYLNEEWRDKVPSHNGLVADFSAYEKKTLEDYLEERDRLQEAEGQAGSRHEAEKIRARIAGLNKAWDSWRERNQKIYATKSELITELPWTCRQEAEFFASMLNAMQEEVKDLLKVPEYGFNSNELNNAITICAWIAEFVKNNQPYTGLGSTAFEPVRQASSLREVYDALDDIIESMGYEPPEEANDYDGFISVG